MPAVAKSKPSEGFSELRSMLEVRRQAEQRGHFEPLGRLLYLKTERGNMLWPVEDGECQGPTVAALVVDGPNPFPDFLLLGPWLPLPPVRVQSSKPCPKCLHVCEVCKGAKIKQCEQAGCGGRGTVAVDGQIACDAPGCSGETGAIKIGGCVKCRNTGTLPRYDHCAMCDGTGKMKCPRCRGRGQVATGKVRGSIDWKAKDCPACAGTCWKGAFQPQQVEKFINAQLDPLRFPDKIKFPPITMWALGPIFEMGIEDPRDHATRIFDVAQDAHGDYLMLVIPAGHKRQAAASRAKAYFVAGVVRERAAEGAA